MLPQKIVFRQMEPDKSPRNINKNPSTQKTYDFFICIKDQFIPIQKSKLQDCRILRDKQIKGKKIIHIEEDLEIPMFCQVISYLHGSSLELCTMKQLSAFLDVVDFLSIQTLLQQVQHHILRDIQFYQIFQLLELAQRFCLQKVFNTCFNYLQLDQFEQIKYNKFGFLQCNFQLFQIVLRRHHFLKLRKQIQGLKVIRMYCRRYKYDESILKRLLEKYVYSVKQSIKQLDQGHGLKLLNKLPFKNLLQSGNIELDVKQLSCEDIKNSPYRRKSYAQGKSQKIEQKLSSSVYQQQQQAMQMPQENINNQQVIIISKPIQKKVEIKKQQKNIEKQKNSKPNRNTQQQSESFVTKISGLLNEYQQALDNHDAKLQQMKKVAKSELLSHENQEQYSSSLKFLDQKNLFFTVYLPSQ